MPELLFWKLIKAITATIVLVVWSFAQHMYHEWTRIDISKLSPWQFVFACNILCKHRVVCVCDHHASLSRDISIPVRVITIDCISLFAGFKFSRNNMLPCVDFINLVISVQQGVYNLARRSRGVYQYRHAFVARSKFNVQ